MTDTRRDGHPDESTLVAWVSGTLDDVELESHVMECMLCAARLEQVARVEEMMHEAAAELGAAKSVESDRARRRANKRASMPTGLALAASLVLGLGLPGKWMSVDGEWLGPATVGGLEASVQATPLREAPSCAVPDEQGAELCDDAPSTMPMTMPELELELEGALAMSSMPEPDDGPNLCLDDVDGAGLACGVEPV